MSRKAPRTHRRRKGAFDRFTSNQVYSDGSKVLGQEPTTHTPDFRHNWWDPIEGTSPLPEEQANFYTKRAIVRRQAYLRSKLRRRDQGAAGKEAGD